MWLAIGIVAVVAAVVLGLAVIYRVEVAPWLRADGSSTEHIPLRVR